MLLLTGAAIVGSASAPFILLQPAAAQTAAARAGISRNFVIPAQSLAGALDSFARQSGLRVAIAESLPEITAPAVSGSYAPSQALARLLAGTGLSHRITRNGTAIIGSAGQVEQYEVAANGTTVLERLSVSGEGGGMGGVGEIEITSADLERKDPTDLADVFRGEPGVEVGGSMAMAQKVYVHGIEETNLAVTMDGSRQNNKLFHHNTTNLIDPTLLKAVRVDAGIAPADAGPGALAGAIVYETKDARDFLAEDGIGGFVKSSYNTNGDTFTTGLSAYGIHQGFEFLGYFNFGQGDDYTAGNGQIMEGTGADFLSGIGKLAYEFESGDRFEISHERIRDDAPRPYRANVGFIDGRPPWEPSVRDYKLDRQNTVFTYTDSTPEGWWDPKVVLAYSRSEIEVPDRFDIPVNGSTGSFNGKAENRFALDMGSITAGFDFYSDTAELDYPGEDAEERAKNVGVYAQARLAPWERTRLSFGARADHQWFTGVDGSEWSNGGLSANVSGEYDLVPEFLTAKAGYSHVWAGIPLAENFIMNPGWDYGAGPEPAVANNYTASLIATYNGFTLEGGVFLTDIENARKATWSPASTGALAAHDVRSKGFEIGAGYDWASGFVRVKYANIDVTIDGAPADSDLGQYLATPAGEFITLSAAHTFVHTGLTVGGDVEIAFDYQVFEGYETANLFAEYRPPSMPHLTLRAEVQNLFDANYASRATYGQEFPTVTPLYEPGRSFILSAKATF